jgi:hypothetical protein
MFQAIAATVSKLTIPGMRFFLIFRATTLRVVSDALVVASLKESPTAGRVFASSLSGRRSEFWNRIFVSLGTTHYSATLPAGARA